MVVKKEKKDSKKVLKKTEIQEKVVPKNEEVIEVEVQKETRPYFMAVGRRKTAVARLNLFSNGKGIFEVNGMPVNEYFKEPNLVEIILTPFNVIGNEKDFDFKCKISGGGKHAQAEAARHAVSRALVELDAELRTTLKKSGFLSRDSRAKERKKYGLKRARKAPQFSKR